MDSQLRWDVVAISAMNSGQASAFERQLASHRDGWQNLAAEIRVYEDEPEGVKIGGGGATLSIIHRLKKEMGETIFDSRILIIHAGGLSQRQPNASKLGKLFISLPMKRGNGDGPFSYASPNLLEAKLQSYQPLLRRMKPGIFMAASDTLEYLGDLDASANHSEKWALDGDGFVALAHPSTLEIGRQHGVYVLDGEIEQSQRKKVVFEATCRRVLQKPTVDVMRKEGAIVEGKNKEPIVYTDSAYYMSPNVVRKLLRIYENLSPLDCELDGYGDFLQPLGSNATDEYLRTRAVNALVQNDALSAARRYLFEELREFPLKVLVFTESRFYHLGTFGELLNYFCQPDNNDFRKDFGTESVVCSLIKAPRIPPTVCVIGSDIGNHFKCSDSSKAIIEYCQFSSGFEFPVVGGECVLSNCVTGTQAPVVIPASVFIMTMPVGRDRQFDYVTVIFGIRDDLKAEITSDGPLPVSTNSGGFSALQFFKNPLPKTKIEGNHSLWHARLFPEFESKEESFDWSLKWLSAIVDGTDTSSLLENLPYGVRFYSMNDLVARPESEIDGIISLRHDLRKRINDQFSNVK